MKAALLFGGDLGDQGRVSPRDGGCRMLPRDGTPCLPGCLGSGISLGSDPMPTLCWQS